MFRLDNKVAIITGAGSGIGKAIAMLFAQQGGKVYILDTDDKNGNDTADTIKIQGGMARFLQCNIAHIEDVKTNIGIILSEEAGIDIIVNNAGIAHIGNIENTNSEDIDRLYAVNIKGIYHVLREAIPAMKQKGGAILNLASVAATVGITERFAYSMTKAAVVGMTLSVAKDYLQYGIRCNCISPGRVHTPFVDGYLKRTYPGQEQEMFDKLAKTQPMGRMGKPEEIAHLALYLCSEEANFITGCDYPIDGGFIKLNS